MNIIVLAGGTSTERSVSVVSGTQVTRALRSLGHKAVLEDVFVGDARLEKVDGETLFSEEYDLDEAVAYITSWDDQIQEILKERRNNRKPFFGPHILEMCQAADAVFLALHGSNGEDGRIQAAFDLLGIPYTGSGYLGSALAMDKELSKQMFAVHGVPTPAGIVLRSGEKILPSSENTVGLPCVVKPSCGGSSVGVSVAYTEEEYRAALEEGFRYENVLVVEQYVKGREFSVGVVDSQAYPVIEIAPIEGFYNYSNKYKVGSTVETCPADLDEETTIRMQHWAVEACRALNVDNYGRVDIMMNEQGEMFCLEANTLPGMTPTSLLPQEAAALGIDFPHLCEKLIQVSLRR